MKDLLNFLVTSIVAKPEKVKIEEEKENDFTIFSVSLDQEDAKHVIGKGGETIRAIKNLLKSLGQNLYFTIKINSSD